MSDDEPSTIEVRSAGVAKLARKFFAAFRPQSLSKKELQRAEEILQLKDQEGKKYD